MLRREYVHPSFQQAQDLFYLCFHIIDFLQREARAWKEK